jgi:hypothetical protein
MGFGINTYWLTDRQSQCDFERRKDTEETLKKKYEEQNSTVKPEKARSQKWSL